MDLSQCSLRFKVFPKSRHEKLVAISETIPQTNLFQLKVALFGDHLSDNFSIICEKISVVFHNFRKDILGVIQGADIIQGNNAMVDLIEWIIKLNI